MRDILPDIDNWRADEINPSRWRPSFKPGDHRRGRAGAKMAITLDGKITGSVSGGCVEGAVIEAGVEVLKSNHSATSAFWRGR